jgi:hypothetical protein
MGKDVEIIYIDEIIYMDIYLSMSGMRTTEEEGVWKGHSSAFFSSLLLRIPAVPIFLAEAGDGASSPDLPRSRNAVQPSLHSGLEGMTIISA